MTRLEYILRRDDVLKISEQAVLINYFLYRYDASNKVAILHDETGYLFNKYSVNNFYDVYKHIQNTDPDHFDNFEYMGFKFDKDEILKILQKII